MRSASPAIDRDLPSDSAGQVDARNARSWPGLARIPVVDNPDALTRVMVVAGYPAVRAGLATLLSQQADFLILETNSIPDDDNSAPDIIVADSGSTNDDLVDDLAESYPRASFIFVGGDPTVDGPGIESGPIAYLGPEVDGAALALAVRGVAHGLTVIDPGLIVASGVHLQPSGPAVAPVSPGEALTAREREVLELVAAGLPNKTIARELGISEHTAKFHVGSLLAKLGAASRTEAVTIATRRGILSV